ncbi:MAG TPA: hypothetical protein VNW28_08260, partial [Chthoniobacterales bacterium]|nr:hypothetical protein [Chthoniobacterales bacterium]
MRKLKPLPVVAPGRNLAFGSIMAGTGNDEGEANANRELVDALRRSKLFRDYERVFSEATGLPLALRPLE